MSILELKTSKLASGRVGIYVPDHPKANNRGYILRSRYNMEQYLGRRLESCEIVHHCDGDKLNDVYENLELMLKEEHDKKHNNLLLSGYKQRLDYIKIEKLRKLGFGYKRISKMTGYPLSSIKSAVKKITTGSY